MLAPEQQGLILDWMVLTINRALPSAGHRPMYGGTVFEREIGNPKTCVCGLYAYREHLSIEFTNGALLDDPLQVLEGGGKFRRHIKLHNMVDLLTKDVEGYIIRAFKEDFR